MRYAQGAPVRITTVIRDSNGTLVNPSSIVLTVRKPDGTDLTFNTPTNDIVGQYHQDLAATDLTLLGRYLYKWVATGIGASVSYGNFDVFDPLEPTVLSLQDAKAALNIPATVTVYDSEILDMASSIEGTLERITGGPLITREITDEPITVSAGGTAIVVRYRPLVDVVNIIDDIGTTLPIGDIVFDPNSGVVNRRLGLPFLGRGISWTISYTAGWGTQIPPAFNAAARILLQYLWESQRGPSMQPSPGGEELSTQGGTYYPVPSRVLQLMAPYTLEAFV